MDGINKCVEDGSTELVKVALSQSARNEVRSICNNNGCQKYIWNLKYMGHRYLSFFVQLFLFKTGRFSISSVTETGPTSCTASPTRSRFSVERVDVPPVTAVSQSEADISNENGGNRFTVSQVSDSGSNAQTLSQPTQSENYELMSGSVSSTVSSGGNNTPYIGGTPTSTVHSQKGNEAAR